MQDLEPIVHGRGRKDSMDEMYFGVHDQLLYARKTEPVQGNTYLPSSVSSQCMQLPSRLNLLYICCGICLDFIHVGAQWTGIVTTIAVEMLKADMVDAVVCVQRHQDKNRIPHCLSFLAKEFLVDLTYALHLSP